MRGWQWVQRCRSPPLGMGGEEREGRNGGKGRGHSCSRGAVPQPCQPPVPKMPSCSPVVSRQSSYPLSSSGVGLMRQHGPAGRLLLGLTRPAAIMPRPPITAASPLAPPHVVPSPPWRGVALSRQLLVSHSGGAAQADDMGRNRGSCRGGGTCSAAQRLVARCPDAPTCRR